MENQKLTTEWALKNGNKVVVTAELILTEAIYADGDNITVDCCKMGLIKAKIDGYPDQYGLQHYPTPPTRTDNTVLAGSIGKLGLEQDKMDKVDALINQLKQHPMWVAKQNQIKKNEKTAAIQEETRRKNGYCYKCGSYCYGDCEVN